MASDIAIEENVPLAPLCSLELGGNARYLVTAPDEPSVAEAVRWAAERRLQVAVLGGGTNLVVADAGFDGLVIRMKQRGVSARRDDGALTMTAAAGEPWDALVERAVSDGLSGVECLSGIPGCVGATVIQNVGAYGQEIAETVSRTRVLDRDTVQVREVPGKACGFAYRDSIFKRKLFADVILSVSVVLRPGGSPRLRNPELQAALEVGEAAPGPAEVRDAVLELRRRKSMLAEPADENRRSVGSFFVNPTVDPERADAIARRAVEAGVADAVEKVPRWPQPDGRVRLAAAWLIEKSGFEKGFRDGAVGLSSRHALSLVHHGGGSTSALIRLAKRIRGAVNERFGVRLTPEPAFLGFDEPPL
jgi:UDP-N-acetylmuramate dehydrogenase